MTKEVENIVRIIPTGKEGAMLRPWSRSEDRSIREAINAANKEGDCIINVGTGYFRPDPEDNIDASAFEEYIRKEYHRAKDIITKCNRMRQAFNEKKIKGGKTNV